MITKPINYLLSSILLFVVVFSLSTCKKYPENTIWFKNVKNIPFFINKLKLTQFKVNGIDSLQLLNAYFGSRVYVKNINECYFHLSVLSSDFSTKAGIFQPMFGNNYYIEIAYSYLKNKKFIDITFGINGLIDTTIIHRNLFVDNTTPWQIIKLETAGSYTRKIKKTVNNNTYELQFDLE